MVKCANPECNHHRPTGFLESLWTSRGFTFDGRWFCSNSCYKRAQSLEDEEVELESDDPSADMRNMKLGEILVAYGIIGNEELTACLSKDNESDKRVGQLLVESGLITREAVLAALSKQKGIPWIDVFMLSYDDAALSLISKEDARKNLAIPFGFMEDQVLVAMADANNDELIKRLGKLMGRPVKPVFSPEEDLVIAIEQAFAADRMLGRRKKAQKLSPTDRRLGQILLVERIITPAQLEQAITAQFKDHSRIGEILLKLGSIDERQLAAALGKQCGCMWIDLSVSAIPDRLIALFSRDLAGEHRVVPVKYSDGILYVATDDPTDRFNVKRLATTLNRRIEPLVCTKTHLVAALRKYYGINNEEVEDG